MNKLKKQTPLQKYGNIWVKREDLACPAGCAPLAKMRGVDKRLDLLREKGYTKIGVYDTKVSKAGWGTAWLSQTKGLKCYIYYPLKKEEKNLPIPIHQQKAQGCGGILRPLPASKISIVFNRGKKDIEKMGGVMLPLGLPLFETVTAVAEEAKTIPNNINGTLIITAGTGTILAGVLCGLKKLPKKIYVINIGHRKNLWKHIVKLMIEFAKKNKLKFGRIIQAESIITWIKPVETYYEKPQFKAPFPCHPNYDLKAWKWLKLNKEKLIKPVLFWNIGG